MQHLNETNSAAQVMPLQTTIDYNEMIEVDAHERFPEVIKVPGQLKVRMRKHRHPDCQESNPFYIPEEEVFKKSVIWWIAPRQPKPLCLVGETGTGKTEMLLYIADRLNEPVYIEKVTTGMRAEASEGGYDLSTDASGNSVTVKRYSKASIGYKHGGLVIFDEIDKTNDDLSTALHLYLEGKPFPMSVFSETITKHANCRIAATSNTTGDGDSERYITSQKLDSAIRNRLGFLYTKYPEPSLEMDILEKQYSQLPYDLRHRMVKTANALRDALLGPNRDDEIDNPIGAPFSTRTIVDWGFYLCMYGSTRSPLESLDFVYMGSVDKGDKPDVMAILQRVWGDELNKPISVFFEKASSTKKP